MKGKFPSPHLDDEQIDWAETEREVVTALREHGETWRMGLAEAMGARIRSLTERARELAFEAAEADEWNEIWTKIAKYIVPGEVDTPDAVRAVFNENARLREAISDASTELAHMEAVTRPVDDELATALRDVRRALVDAKQPGQAHVAKTEESRHIAPDMSKKPQNVDMSTTEPDCLPSKCGHAECGCVDCAVCAAQSKPERDGK